MKIALITGASSGIGREFVYALDKDERYDEIWVVARRRELLEKLEGEVETKLRIIPMDLGLQSSIDEIVKIVRQENIQITTLVHAAGFGIFEKFENAKLETYYNMIDVNIKSSVGLLYGLLDYMDEKAEIYILGSMSSFQPVPYINIYGASKAFVVSFSRALNAEMKSRGLKIMAVCPLWVQTEFLDKASGSDIIKYYNFMYKAKDVVKKAIKDMKKGKDISVLGIGAKLQLLGVKLLPHRLVMKVWLKQQGL